MPIIKEQETTMYFQVQEEGKETREYKGFWGISNGRIDKLDYGMHKGLIALVDEDVIRWFVYDRHYIHALAEFYRYCHDEFEGVVPPHRIMDYQLHNERGFRNG